ncbi:hypothetical protein Hypma_010415 [Hypsizygus marmoreus]|uniref:Uncharacterized protein n=1 Tax=Hypsizygus marmoreus TaxID=39966 RepID=A0A369JPG6_HYPMA|nr:hypothetical protein Hypma_010415 [Hypsizygus marmoreus]
MAAPGNTDASLIFLSLEECGCEDKLGWGCAGKTTFKRLERKRNREHPREIWRHGAQFSKKRKA